ncbi:MAG TPA: hypothetical protein DCG28_00120 [Lachnospiraceae bacterium]|nr:hypothetical protein [Lachnospiraceae bacterium]
MKEIMGSFSIAFSRYSKISMPYMEWKPEDMKYIFCFFPLVGFMLGAVELLAYFLCDGYGVHYLLRAAILTAIPVLYTGAIHIKGFMATKDAFAGNGNPSQLIAFMELGHVGPVSMIHLFTYMLLTFAAFASVNSYKTMFMVALSFVFSRAFCSVVILSMSCVKKTGTFYAFYKNTDRKATGAFTVLWIALTVVMLELILPIETIFLMAVELGFLYLYIRDMKNRLGGITGDTVHYFQYVAETTAIVIIALGTAFFGI